MTMHCDCGFNWHDCASAASKQNRREEKCVGHGGGLLFLGSIVASCGIWKDKGEQRNNSWKVGILEERVFT